MQYYKRLAKDVHDKYYKLYPIETDFWDEQYITTTEKNWFEGIFEYTEEQYEFFKKEGHIRGITDVTTRRLVFDLDATPENLDPARINTLALITRLREHGIPEEAISIAFSGNRGFSLQVNLLNRITLEQVKNICPKLGENLSIDLSIYTNSGLFRIIGTKHNKSGLYKTCLSKEELENLTDIEIKEKASNLNNCEDLTNTLKIQLPESILNLKFLEKKKEMEIVIDNEINFTQKPKGWSNCKWAMTQGYGVEPSSRKLKLMSIIATSKSLNFTKEQAYYMAKNAYEKGMERYGGEPFKKEELWDGVADVYSPTWNGGTYSCKDGKTPWLTQLCNSLGRHKCQTSDINVVTTDKVFDLFKDYAENFEKNVLTTGIELLDENCKLLVGTSNGILAPPGVGKTTLSLSILNHNSNQGNTCVFFSYDMFHSMVYLRLVQKHFGYNQDKVFDIFKNNKKESEKIQKVIDEEYKNVHFCFKSGQTADEIYETILDVEQSSGKKVKLAMVDYNELVISGVTDPTQSSAQVAQRLRQIANDASTCVVTLLQPSKIFSNPSDEITTYQGAKGSGAIAQSLSLMLSLSRPGFHPRKPDEDKYLTINALKHRQGGLFTIDLFWDGLSGQIRDLTDEETHELIGIRANRAAEKSDDGF